MFKRLSALLTALLAFSTQAVQAQVNELAVGAKSTVQTSMYVAVEPPQELNFHTRTDVLNLRGAYVSRFPQLLAAPYHPTPDIFGAIVDNKPWWGLRGEAVWGQGKRSIEGLSEESRFILNPFLLVAANPHVCDIWSQERITEEDLDRSDFPYTWLPASLIWNPPTASAEVIYQVTDFNRRLNLFKEKLIDAKLVPKFALVAYNARDFGYHWIWLDAATSTNIEVVNKTRDATRIDQMIHCGDSCQYPGGCNNMSPSIPAIDDIEFKSIPARARVLLWKEKPKDVRQTPDFTVFVTLQ